MNVILEVVGWVGSAILVVSLLQTGIVRLRMLNLAGTLVLLLYNALIEVWPMVGLNVALAAINIYFLAGLLRGRDDEKNYTVIEVEPEDRYLAHVLAVHAKDIKSYNPSFGGAPDPHQLAFLVQRGSETIGVVLVSDAGDGVAQIDLDYVTRRFRDFSPGQFVFGDSHIFAERGFRQILTSPDMVNPYYARLGFREVGNRYVRYLDPSWKQ